MSITFPVLLKCEDNHLNLLFVNPYCLSESGIFFPVLANRVSLKILLSFHLKLTYYSLESLLSIFLHIWGTFQTLDSR